MVSSNQQYFEQPEVWEPSKRDHPAEHQRVSETMDAIPLDAQSILDVGCGSGEFVNALLSRGTRSFSRVVGTDISAEALTSVKAEKRQCPITGLPFEDRELDLVSCLEVLEHINADEFSDALSEIARVSRQYILVSVPNKEELVENLVVCPKCSCCFSPWFHVRSFDESLLSGLFSDFKLRECKGVGPIDTRRVYHPVARGVQLLGKRPAPPPHSICPQCQYRQPGAAAESRVGAQEARRSFITRCARMANGMLARSRSKHRWLLALYVREDGK